MSRAIQLLDSTVLMMVDQEQAYGRWHIGGCTFLVVSLSPSHHAVPGIVTDRMLYRLSRNTGRPRGYRSMTPEETARWHREQPCWTECQGVQQPEAPGVTSHIDVNCSVRCRAVQDTIERNAVTLGATVTKLRTLADRRHRTRRYLSDGDTHAVHALYDGDNGTRGGSRVAADHSRTERGPVGAGQTEGV